MTEKEIKKYVDLVAARTVEMLLKKLEENGSFRVEEEWIDAKEAARIARVTPIYLRSMKDKFSYRKVGGTKRGRVLFKRQEITDYFVNNTPNRS